ncbi:MAG: acyl-CoA dehydrogenase domain-containing protein, partial [Roseobacter sp.]
TQGLYLTINRDDPIGLMDLTLEKVMAAEPVEQKIGKAQKRSVNPVNYERVHGEALKAGVINDIEAETVREAMILTTEAISVDDFPGRSAEAGQQAA